MTSIYPPENEGRMSRRDFLLNWLLGLGGLFSIVGVLSVAVKYIFPPRRTEGSAEEKVAVAKVGEIPEGEAKPIMVGSETAVLINLQGKYLALGTKCTHLGCIVKWDASSSLLKCPCHAGIYDTKGQLVSGPPPSPLPVFTAIVSGQDIFVGRG
jgi:Rieske Fe-S protein